MSINPREIYLTTARCYHRAGVLSPSFDHHVGLHGLLSPPNKTASQQRQSRIIQRSQYCHVALDHLKKIRYQPRNPPVASPAVPKTPDSLPTNNEGESQSATQLQSTLKCQHIPGKNIGEFGVIFFGEKNLPYYTCDKPKLGAPNRPFFFIPAQDTSEIKNAADAARCTGHAPSALDAYLNHQKVYGMTFPLPEIKNIRLPVRQDARGWPHFIEGGHTAVALSNEQGYLLNGTREFVLAGGQDIPSGARLFRLNSQGSHDIIREYP